MDASSHAQLLLSGSELIISLSAACWCSPFVKHQQQSHSSGFLFNFFSVLRFYFLCFLFFFSVLFSSLIFFTVSNPSHFSFFFSFFAEKQQLGWHFLCWVLQLMQCSVSDSFHVRATVFLSLFFFFPRSFFQIKFSVS